MSINYVKVPLDADNTFREKLKQLISFNPDELKGRATIHFIEGLVCQRSISLLPFNFINNCYPEQWLKDEFPKGFFTHKPKNLDVVILHEIPHQTSSLMQSAIFNKDYTITGDFLIFKISDSNKLSGLTFLEAHEVLAELETSPIFDELLIYPVC